MTRQYKPFTIKYTNAAGEVVERTHHQDSEQKRRHYLTKKINDPNRYLKRRRPITDPLEIMKLGKHYNNGYYYNSVAMSKVLNVNPCKIRVWIKQGKIPGGQFVLGTDKYVINLYRFEEIWILACLLYEYYELNDLYMLKNATGKKLRDNIFYNFKLIYDEREANGIEKYQPEI